MNLNALGGIRQGAEAPLKLILDSKKKEAVYELFKKNGMPYDFGKATGAEINAYLRDLSATVGTKLKQVPESDTFQYLYAHGAAQIRNVSNNTEVMSFVENLKHPIKDFVSSLFSKHAIF